MQQPGSSGASRQVTPGGRERARSSPLTESNRRPSPYHGDALPTELRGRQGRRSGLVKSTQPRRGPGNRGPALPTTYPGGSGGGAVATRSSDVGPGTSG